MMKGIFEDAAGGTVVALRASLTTRTTFTYERLRGRY